MPCTNGGTCTLVTPTKLVHSGDHALQPHSPAKISHRWTISPIVNDRWLRNSDQFVLYEPSRRWSLQIFTTGSEWSCIQHQNKAVWWNKLGLDVIHRHSSSPPMKDTAPEGILLIRSTWCGWSLPAAVGCCTDCSRTLDISPFFSFTDDCGLPAGQSPFLLVLFFPYKTEERGCSCPGSYHGHAHWIRTLC